MFSKKASKLDNKSKKKSKSAAAAAAVSSTTGSVDEQKSVPDLICRSYADGCLVLGSIHHIAHDDLTITLPGINNFGYVRINHISPEYVKYLQSLTDKREYVQLSNMYTIGQLLRCKVLNYTNKRLNLTIEPHEVNANLKLKDLDVDMIVSGSIKSKEDHGYSVSLGISETVAFLNNEELTDDSVHSQLQIGKTINFKVKSLNKRVVNLTLAESKEFDVIKYKANFNTYLPGSRLACNVEKAYKNGLKLSINGVQSIVGYIHVNHLGSKLSSLKTLKAKYQHGDKMDATAMYINPYSKVIYLTQLDHLSKDNSVSKIEELVLLNKLGVGSFINDAKVIRHSLKGIYVLFNFDKYKNLFGFISKRDLIDKEELEKSISDDKSKGGDADEEQESESLTQFYWKHITKEFVEKYYALNKVLPNARVLDYTFIDNLVMLTTRASKLNEDTYLSYSDAKLKVGEVVKCKVIAAANGVGGLVVRLSDHVRGFIPKMHTADIPLSDPLAKMPVDKEVKCKIIQVNANDKKLILTAKKTFIKMKPEEEIKAIDENIKIGFMTYGIIVAIKEYGLLVGFYNEIKALVHIGEIPNITRKANEPVDLNKYYSVGQLVKVKVIGVDLAKQQLRMSLRLDDSDIVEQEARQPKFVRMSHHVGDLITPSVSTQVVVQFKNFSKNYFFIKLSSGNTFEFAVLYKYHLSDNEHLNDILFSLFRKNTSLSDFFSLNEHVAPSLLVLHDKSNEDSTKAYKKYFLTGKRSLINVYANEIEHENDELYTGWVCKKQEKGVLIEIVSKSKDLVTGTMAYCSNKIIKKLNLSVDAIHIGQTVTCRIDKMKKMNNLLLVNAIYFSGQLAVDCLSSTLNTIKLLLKSSILDTYTPSEQDPDALKWFKQLKSSQTVSILSSISVVVKSVDQQTNKISCVYEEEGLNAYGYLNIEDTLDEKALVDTKLQAVVIGYDHTTASICLALEPSQQNFLKKHKHSISSHSNSDVLRVDQVVKGELVGFTREYCIVALKQHAMGRLAYMPLLINGDEIQSKNMEDLNKLASLENGTKARREYTNYYSIGHVGKFMVKHLNDDYVLCKLEGKLKQKANKSDDVVAEKVSKKAAKRKAENGGGDSIEIVKKVKNGSAKSEDTGLGSSIEYPWEITNFDQFYELIREPEASIKRETNGDEKQKPLNKKQKKAQMEAADKEIQLREEKLFDRPLDATNAETPDDFERLLVSSPNSSLVWIRYIVYYLQSAEIEKSRNIAERALKTIIYRDEAERMNVWVAYLNLENMYGSVEKLEEVFQRAVQNCDTLKVYEHLAEIYARSSKNEEAETLYNKMTRKFNKNPEVWIKYAIFEYRSKNCEVARKLLIKCLNVLEKKDHIDVVNKFAQLEFKYGDLERAKTMYDSLLFTYPNRTDLWSVYIDMLVKYDRKNEARNIFNRIIQMNLNAKRMKFIFKKYLDFEKANGDDEKVDYVKQMAMKYVENKEEVFRMALKSQNDDSQQDIEMLDEDANGDLEKNLIKKLKV